MADLLFKTRANTDPQGKPKVYFSAHPEDFHFLEPISKEILEISNCAVWYDSDPLAPCDMEAHLSRLDDMNLFVIPVTEKWLTDPSRSLSVEFEHAKKRHIPILPIMQGEGLISLFNENCGDIQFLDPAANDQTAIPYAEKLSRFLNSVLIGDELSAKIRAAFDAYIFLSYRKKDRKYAKELMRLIHKNDFCRDIAIWYDEFLIPGENFNHLIEEALKKSDLFALTVTPNMVNETNYVMNIEYPMAKNAGKEILAAEIVDTDRERLCESFSELPEVIDANDSAALSRKLLEALRAVALRQSDNDPEHNFFIGLAYLSGIDVERDPERAIEIITSSADAGLPEAAARLASIYQNAEGVERDYEKSIYWQKRLCALRLEILEKELTEQKALVYLHDSVALGETYDMLARYEEAKMLYWMLLERVRAWRREYGFSSMRSSQIVCLNELGKFAEVEGKYSRAEEYYRGSLEILETLPDKKESREAAWIYTSLGSVALADERFAEARGYYEKALDIFTKIDHREGAPKTRVDIAHAHDMLGRIAESFGSLDEALSHYETSYELCHGAAEESKSVDCYRKEAFALKNISDVYELKGELERALEYMTDSVLIRSAIDEQLGSILSKRELALGLSSLGDICKKLGNYNVAMEYFDQSLGLRREIYERTGTADSKRELSLSLNEIGDVACLFGMYDAARTHFDSALKLREELALSVESASARYDIMSVCNRIGDLLQNVGKSDEAVAYHEKALKIGIEVMEKHPTSAAKGHLFNTCCFLGRAYERQMLLSEAREKYERAASLAEELAKESDTAAARRNVSISLGQLGSICELERNYEKAIGYYERVLDILKKEAEDHDTLEVKRDKAVNYSALARAYFGLRKLPESIDYHKKSIAAYEEIHAAAKTDLSEKDLLIAYRNTGRVLLRVSQPDNAIPHLEKALNIVRAQLAKEETVYSDRDLGEILGDLAEAYGMVDEFTRQTELLEELLMINKEIAEKSGSVEDNNRVAGIYSRLGYAARSEGNLTKAVEHFTASLEIREALSERSDETRLLDDLAHSHFDMGSILVSLGSKNARVFLARAAEIVKILIERCPEDRFYERLIGSINMMLMFLPE